LSGGILIAPIGRIMGVWRADIVGWTFRYSLGWLKALLRQFLRALFASLVCGSAINWAL